jgi:hypothetical protein
MPDWVTHLGTAYIGARVARVREVQLVLLGAILPDVVIPTFVAIDLWHLPVSLNMFAYLIAFHSLTIVSLLAAAIALLHMHASRCFLLIWGGAATHFLLDVLETDIDCGMRVFYPFSFRSWSPGWLATGRNISILLLVVAAVALGLALTQSARLVKLGFQPKRKALWCAVALAAIAFLLPLLTRQTVVDQNVHFLAFFSNPEAWQDRSVELCFSEVISRSPVEIKEFDKQFELVTKENLAVGEHVSVRGVYRDRKIYPTRLYIHRGFSKAWLSLVGLVVLFVLLIPGKGNGRGQAARKVSPSL